MVDIEAVSGDVTLTEANGNVRVDVDSGNLLLDEIGARVEASVLSGNVTGIQLSGTTFESNVLSGNTDLTFDAVPEIVESFGDSGNITLRVPAGEYDIDATSRRGTVSILNVTNTPGADSVLIASTESGNIDITTSE